MSKVLAASQGEFGCRLIPLHHSSGFSHQSLTVGADSKCQPVTTTKAKPPSFPERRI